MYVFAKRKMLMLRYVRVENGHYTAIPQICGYCIVWYGCFLFSFYW